MASQNSPTGNTVIIGIDFGTTYSGVAFTWSNKIDRMEVIRSWESEQHSNSDEPKAPTAISFGPKSVVNWGYGIPQGADQVKWFKLLLVDDKDLPDDVQKSSKLKECRKYLKKHKKTAIEVIALFLRHLWNHSVQRITETVSRNLVNYSKFHIVITLPAIWPEYARSRMREAVSLAGMLGTRIGGETELSFVSEPEAAALATLSNMDGRGDIEAGDVFVVVDCGGGTADLISYEVVSLKPMAVRECVKGQGGLCGAVFVDEAFVDLLKQKFGAAKWANMKTESLERILHNEWEHMIKPTFDGREKSWEIKLPFECLDAKEKKAIVKANGELPGISINAVDVRAVFDPVVNKIRAMVNEQVSSAKAKKTHGPKYIIMAGGFGRSCYLLTALKEGLDGNIEILQSRGSDPWSAICRGAVIHGATTRGLSALSVQVEERISRVNCGVVQSEDWSTEKHDVEDKCWSTSWHAWLATNQMRWFLKAGDPISTSKPVKGSFESLYSTEEAATNETRTTVVYSSVASPPEKTMNNAIEILCRIKWDSDIDITSLPTYINPLGKVFYKLTYEVQMTCVAGSLDFAVYHNGKRQGSKHAVVDYETK